MEFRTICFKAVSCPENNSSGKCLLKQHVEMTNVFVVEVSTNV